MKKPGSQSSLIVALGLVVITLAAFLPTMWFDFVNFEDHTHVLNNPHIRQGFTPKTLKWAFTTGHEGDFNPVTWLSHMLDWKLYGSWAGGHHLTNVLLHTANVLLLFILVRYMTGTLWPSAFVALVFAIHPLRVESVVWISQRKDVLCGFFWMCSLISYARYARTPTVLRYCTVLGTLSLALLAKPMAVTLPVIMLLLDWWPLRRLGSDSESCSIFSTPGTGSSASKQSAIANRVLEKIPMFVLAGLVALVSYHATKDYGIVASLEQLDLATRLANAAATCGRYMLMLVYPVELAPYYPHPGTMPALIPMLLSVAAIIALTAFAIGKAHAFPYLTTGWLWFLASLAPVIGIVKASNQLLADRYTYLPHIGLVICLTWAANALLTRIRLRFQLNGEKLRIAIAAGAIVLTSLLCAQTVRQSMHWQNSVTLWTRSLAYTTHNVVAHNSLAAALLEREGFAEQALEQADAALEIADYFASAHYNRGIALLHLGREDEAAISFQNATHRDDSHAPAHFNLAVIYREKNLLGPAMTHYQKAATANPDHFEAHLGLGGCHLALGNMHSAIEHYRDALNIDPTFAAAHFNLGNALVELGSTDEAIGHYLEAVRIDPTATSYRTLASAWSAKEDYPQAQRYFEAAIEMAPNDQHLMKNIGIVLLRQGKTTLAANYISRGLALAAETGDEELANELESWLNELGYIETVDHNGR